MQFRCNCEACSQLHNEQLRWKCAESAQSAQIIFSQFLKCYYDVNYADRFDEFFGGLDIGKHPTAEHNSYRECFFKQFFNECKGFATDVCLPLDRVFITGVTPVSLDNVTSSFNFAANISLAPTFTTFTGFNHNNIKTILAYYRRNAGFDIDEGVIFGLMRCWYDNYCLSPERVLKAGKAGYLACCFKMSGTMLYIQSASFSAFHLISCHVDMSSKCSWCFSDSFAEDSGKVVCI